jgi:hypothetical protein
MSHGGGAGVAELGQHARGKAAVVAMGCDPEVLIARRIASLAD